VRDNQDKGKVVDMENEKKVSRLYESEEDSYLVEDYPWGFRLRTSRRVWVESKKGLGMRFVAQTMNPKTGKWCKPKKSTYSPVIGMMFDENGYMKFQTLSSGGWSKEEQIVQFEKSYEGLLTDFQKEQIKYVRATNIMNELITYEIKPSVPINLTKVMDGDSEEVKKMKEQDAGQQTKEEKQAILNKAFGYAMAKVNGEVE